MKNVKKIFIGLLVLICSLTLVSCKKSDKYNYPSKTPMVSSPAEKFLATENWSVTNEEAYIKLLSSYGYEEVMKWMDEILYDSSLKAANLEGFNDYLNEQRYGTKDPSELSLKEKKNLDESWAESMASKGFTTEEEWTAHFKLLFLRKQTARKQVVKDIEEFEKLVNVLDGINFPKFVTSDLTLKTKEESISKDLKIEWSSNNEYVKIEKDTAKVTRGKFDAEVTLTAKITLDKVSTQATYKFTVVSRDSEVPTSTENAEKVVNGFFSEDDYKNYLSANYQGNVKTALVFFDSDREARQALKEAGVDLNTINGQAWKDNTGKVLTVEEVKKVFVELYNKTTGKTEVNFDNIVKSYTYDELSKFNSTICTGVYELAGLNSLEEDQDLHDTYTLLPKLYGTKFYLAFNVEKDKLPELDTKKAEIKEKLIDAKVTPDYTDYMMFDNIFSNGTVSIYAEGLENKFVASMGAAYNAAGKKVYDYKRTEGVSSSTVVSFALNGKNYELTADQLFARLVNRYGAQLAIVYLNQYVVLPNSSIYNFLEKSVKDEKKYKKNYEDVVKAAHDKFNKNEYAAEGYPKGYGWENFLRDRYGYIDEVQLLFESSSNIYNEALGNYKKTLTDGRETEIIEKATEIFNDFFKVTSFSLSAFIDNDHDTNPDTLVPEVLDTEDAFDFYTMNSDEFWTKYGEKYAELGATKEGFAEALAALKANYAKTEEFVNYLYSIVELSYGRKTVESIVDSALFATLNDEEKVNLTAEIKAIAAGIAQDNEKTADRLNDLKLYYEIAETSSLAFGQFKINNLEIVISSSTSQTSSSNLTDAYAKELKTIYDDLINYQAAYEAYTKDEKHDSYVYGVDLTGKDLDPYYSYEKTSDITHEKVNYVKGPSVSNAFFNVDRATKVIVTSISDRAKISKTVATAIDEEGKDKVDINGSPVKYVKYDALGFLSDENYQKYLKDSDDDDNTSSGLTSSEKSVISTYYVGAIEEMQKDAEKTIINKQISIVNDSKFVIAAGLKDKVLNILNDNLAK